MSLADQIEQNLAALKYLGQMQRQKMQQQIIQYLLLIKKWNKRYNLTAIRAVEDMLYQHIMDSLAVVNYIFGRAIVDVGSGAGLPGIPLAIARPDWQVTLIESNQKKAAFLQQVKIELNLENIEIKAQRVENTSINKVDTIISRAYASLGAFIKTTQFLISTDDNRCRWIAMKRACTEQELNEVKKPFFIEKTVPLKVPGLFAKRELIIIRRSAEHTGVDQE